MHPWSRQSHVSQRWRSECKLVFAFASLECPTDIHVRGIFSRTQLRDRQVVMFLVGQQVARVARGTIAIQEVAGSTLGSCGECGIVSSEVAIPCAVVWRKRIDLKGSDRLGRMLITEVGGVNVGIGLLKCLFVCRDRLESVRQG